MGVTYSTQEMGANINLQNFHITAWTVTVQTRTIYEFLGCYYHGCKCQSFRDVKTLTNGETLAERYEQTLARIELLTRAGYTVEVQWECEFEGVAEDLRAHPIVRHVPLNTRDALYRGRTEAMRLHYKIREGEETVQYCDVMSLYPYICKYFKFPIGHPIIHIGDTCADIEACLKMEGLTICKIVPPRTSITPFYHTDMTRNCYSACVEHVSKNTMRRTNVNIAATLIDAWKALGS